MIKNPCINLISGPRNISTALMYSFINRGDTCAYDEPMYAYYLATTGKNHPGREEILSSLPTSFDVVLENYFNKPINLPIRFIKGMAHHYHGLSYDFILDFKNVFLIRDPYQLIASFAKVIEHPSLLDIGLKLEWEIFNFVEKRGGKAYVIDSGNLLKNPAAYLEKLCYLLDIPFTDKMLSWNTGHRKEDGVWAKYWYANVQSSTGFKKQKTSDRKLPERLMPLYNEAKMYYDQLYQHSIKI